MAIGGLVVLFWIVVRRLERRLEVAEQARRQSYEELETRVAERTRELTAEITDRKQAEEKLKLREEQLSDAQRIGRIGHWSFDICTEHFECSEEIFRLYGLEPSIPISWDLCMSAIHEEDRARAKNNREAAIAEGRGYDFDYRILRTDGEVRFVAPSFRRGVRDRELRRYDRFLGLDGRCRDQALARARARYHLEGS